MSLADINFKLSYSPPKDDVINDFFVPTLKESKTYDRAVGFFSSSALMDLSVGLKAFIENEGKIRLICSPRLSQNDIEAIHLGYKNREEIIKISQEALINSFKEPQNYYEEERYNLLAHLIESGNLDIKIAIMKDAPDIAMFHSKLGIMTDTHGNAIAFSGSLNDSENAYRYNQEQIDVYTSLGADYLRVAQKRKEFESFWNNEEMMLDIIPFPEDLNAKIQSYKKVKLDTELDSKQFINIKKKKMYPDIPNGIDLRPYQEDAISAWKDNDFVGIYDMATGTGKTITAIASIVELLKYKKYKLFVVISVPYQHLVDQWSEDLERFNIKYISGYTGSKQKRWKSRLKDEVFNYNHGASNAVCFITTNASYRTQNIQNLISQINGDILLVVDEAHNFGSKLLLNTLDERFKYRLALSATLERAHDEEGTQKLNEYFGKKCIEYSLERAINENMLTEYKYYPVRVYLNEEEREEYIKISQELAKYLVIKKDGSVEYSKSAEFLLIKRSRLIAGASNKIEMLRQVIDKYKEDNHILVYCGATTIKSGSEVFESADENEIRQIDEVQRVLSQEYNMKTCRYTSEETAAQREEIKKDFDDGSLIQALIAIRCLDEGVNIPSIDKAIILASSTNPKEYIQRRGRVLRKYPGKDYAVIIDFVTLPRPLYDVSPLDDLQYDYSLIRRELMRVEEFANLSLNSRDSDRFIGEIEEVYGVISEGEYING